MFDFYLQKYLDQVDHIKKKKNEYICQEKNCLEQDG